MEMTHQLIPFLKRLRLSGILETLDVRNQQAIEGQWSYIEFLARLLEDEVERRAADRSGQQSTPPRPWKGLTSTSTPASTGSKYWICPPVPGSARSETPSSVAQPA